MYLVRRLLSIASFLLFVVSYPELQGPLAILFFFVIVGCIHYVLWGRAMSRHVLPATDPQPASIHEFASADDRDML